MHCILLVLPACQHSAPGNSLPAVTGNNYWCQGKAELISFDVVQECYGEQPQAGEVLVFVFGKQAGET